MIVEAHGGVGGKEEGGGDGKEEEGDLEDGGRRLAARGRGKRTATQGNRGRHNRSGHLSAAAIAVLHEIGSTVWKKEEPHSYSQPYTQTPGPTSAYVTDESTPVELLCFCCLF